MARIVICDGAMTLPRQVLPGSFYMITRRCTQRQFLLRPDPELDNAFLYCLIVAALRYDVGLLHATAMVNHHHTTIYDRFGRLCEFMEHFHKLLAKCVNSMRGRSENCWSSEPPCAVRLLERTDVINKVAYAATNPVKDGLVEWVADWPGVNTIDALFEGRQLRAHRPAFFRTDGEMPTEVSIALELPSQLGDKEEFFDDLRERITWIEARHQLSRSILGRRVLGRERILRQSWRASPDSFEPRRVIRPRLAAQSRWARIEALLRSGHFQREYQRARRALLEGNPIPFPAGTYWMRRFAGVEVSSHALN